MDNWMQAFIFQFWSDWGVRGFHSAKESTQNNTLELLMDFIRIVLHLIELIQLVFAYTEEKKLLINIILLRIILLN